MSVQDLLGGGCASTPRPVPLKPRPHDDRNKARKEHRSRDQAAQLSAHREMTRPSPFSVRGRRALMMMRDEREIAIVRRQLDRLGMTITACDPAEPVAPDESADV